MDVDPEVICLGHATLDAIVVVPRLPGRDERVPADDGALGGGGPAATAAVSLARLGIPVAFAGRVGDDVTGHWIRDGLADEGVDVRDLATAPGTSPLTVVLVGPAGRRTLLPTAGTMAGPALDALAGEPAFLARCRAARWLHVDHIGIRAVPALRAAGVTTPVSYDGGQSRPGCAARRRHAVCAHRRGTRGAVSRPLAGRCAGRGAPRGPGDRGRHAREPRRDRRRARRRRHPDPSRAGARGRAHREHARSG